MLIVFFIISFVLQSYLIYSTSFLYQPELYLFSWFIRNGYIPYRDFFDHHGFLLYLILSPLSFDASFILPKIFYWILQTTNLILFIVVIKKLSSKKGLLLSTFFYVVLNFYISENHLWFETMITTLYLILYILSEQVTNKYKSYLIGFITFMISLLKPLSGLIIFPIAIVKKDIKPVIVYFLGWLSLFSFYNHVNGINQLYNNLFKYNSFLFNHYQRTITNTLNYLTPLILIMMIVGLFYIYKQRLLKSYITIFIFVIFSSVSLITDVGKWHMLPLFTFLLIFFFKLLNDCKKTKIFYYTMFILLIITCIYVTRRSVHLYKSLHGLVFPEVQDIELINRTLQTKGVQKNNLYILGDHSYEYITFQVIPPSYYTMSMHFSYLEYFDSDYQDRITSDLMRNKVKFIVIEKINKKLKKIMSFIKSNYTMTEEWTNYQLYQKVY